MLQPPRGDAEELDVGNSPQSLPRPGHWLRSLGVVAVFAMAVLAGVYWYSQRNVHHISLRPGETAGITIEIPMQRFGRPKSFAKEFNLPVRCTITSPRNEPDGVIVSAPETGHKVHKMWAKLRITASGQTPPGRRTRSIDFTIDGQGGWPQATVVVDVQP